MALSYLNCKHPPRGASQLRGSLFSKHCAPLATECQLILPLASQPESWILAGRKALFEYIWVALANEPVEHLIAIYLDTDLSLLKMKSIDNGSLDTAELQLSNVLRDGVAIGAAALILIHNHPNGNAQSSKDDVVTTRKIREISSYLNMPLLDHLIITESGISSIGLW